MAIERITIPDARADVNYKCTIGDLARAMGDFTAQQRLQRRQYDFGVNDAKRRMGYVVPQKRFDANRPGAYGESYRANAGDFGGRGALHSSAYLNSLGDINRDFNDRRTALDTARNDNVNTQTQARSTFANSQAAVKNAALTDAIAGIAARYGINPSAVPQGRTSTITRERLV